MNPGAKAADVLVAEGKLANVFVYIKSGEALAGYSFALSSTGAELEHSLCAFSPRVLGVQVGQMLKIINTDFTTHNTHAFAKNNEGWNFSQEPNGKARQFRFGRPEMFIPFKCNQHPWEIAYVSVLPHPFFAVSDKAGRFVIRGVPPGVYTLAARHEKLGEQTVNIAVGARESSVMNFTFEKSR